MVSFFVENKLKENVDKQTYMGFIVMCCKRGEKILNAVRDVVLGREILKKSFSLCGKQGKSRET